MFIFPHFRAQIAGKTVKVEKGRFSLCSDFSTEFFENIAKIWEHSALKRTEYVFWHKSVYNVC